MNNQLTHVTCTVYSVLKCLTFYKTASAQLQFRICEFSENMVPNPTLDNFAVLCTLQILDTYIYHANCRYQSCVVLLYSSFAI